MTKGGPADSSTTFATWSYQLGFGNLLVVAALVFGLVYRRQGLTSSPATAHLSTPTAEETSNPS
ncbi:hypothetical protein GCM10010094_80540 [Streptomyces flaveus]|uniref:Uncharacterized protein n=1 Tax=Streptomyces flaveus TaxID=66370 RepID=A0A917VRN6_9ACTN|nr:hypothetical protein GCM10010094_80540 [Streptomyces flaveus]